MRRWWEINYSPTNTYIVGIHYVDLANNNVARPSFTLVNITRPCLLNNGLGMLTFNANCLLFYCKVISCFLLSYDNLGKKIKEYIALINKLTLLFLIARITLQDFSKNQRIKQTKVEIN